MITYEPFHKGDKVRVKETGKIVTVTTVYPEKFHPAVWTVDGGYNEEEIELVK